MLLHWLCSVFKILFSFTQVYTGDCVNCRVQHRKIANKMQVACKLPDRTVAKSEYVNEEPFDYSNSLYQRVVCVLKYDGKVEMSINA